MGKQRMGWGRLRDSNQADTRAPASDINTGLWAPGGTELNSYDLPQSRLVQELDEGENAG